jgi:iron complex transport system substrate-binding protein
MKRTINHLCRPQPVHFSYGRWLLGCLALFCLIGFSAAATGKYPAQLTDQYDRMIVLTKEPRRIVSASPGNTEILYELGLGSRIVGVTDWCDYPPAARRKKRIGNITPLNVERILALRPDLVVADSLNGVDGVRGLERFRIPVLALQPDSLEKLFEAVKLCGRATGMDRAAAALVAKMRTTVAGVERQGRAVRGKKLKVLVILGAEVKGAPIWSPGPGSFLDQAVRLAGGFNLFADLRSPWGQVSYEAILKRNPDVILTDLAPDRLYRDPAFNRLSAGRKRQIYRIDVDVYSRPGPRLVASLPELVTLLEKSRP